MKKRIAAALLGAVALVGCVPFFSGCSADISYKLVEKDGDKYYVASCSGVPSALTGTVEISDYIDGVPVKEIAAEGFTNAAMKKLVIPATVERLGMVSFAYCNNLAEIEFAEGSAITEITQGVFAYCTSLKSVTLPDGIEKIGPMAFTGDTMLGEAALPATVGEISYKAFENCTRLQSITLPDGLKKIGELAFYTSGLTEITVPEGVESLGKGAFHSCTSLKTARVDAKIETVDSGVFGYCTALEIVYLPATVKKIEGAYYSDGAFILGHAFHNCAALKDIWYGGTEDEWKGVKVIVGADENSSNAVVEEGASYDNSAVIKATKHFADK